MIIPRVAAKRKRFGGYFVSCLFGYFFDTFFGAFLKMLRKDSSDINPHVSVKRRHVEGTFFVSF